jgi:uncharacterized protein (DUF3820 family)
MSVMPFGKFKGYQLEHVPSSYLVFVAEQCENVEPGLLYEVRQEVAKRYGQFQFTKPSLDRNYVVDWIRRASLEAHPDHGGSVGMMKLVNELRERL